MIKIWIYSFELWICNSNLKSVTLYSFSNLLIWWLYNFWLHYRSDLVHGSLRLMYCKILFRQYHILQLYYKSIGLCHVIEIDSKCIQLESVYTDRFLTFPNQHGTVSGILMLTSINAFFNLCTVHQSPKTFFSIQHWKRVCERQQRNKRKTKSTMRPLTACIDWRSTHSNVCVW